MIGGAEVVSQLETVLPHDRALSGDAVSTWQFGGHVPDAVVFPRTVEEVASVLKLATAEGWAVLPAGTGDWLNGAPAPRGERTSIVLSTRRMDRILEYEPADLTISAEAGITLEQIQRVVNAEGQWLPLDPRPDDRGTLGATLATASRGPIAGLLGAPRDLVLGLELITGDGRRVRVGGRVVKNVAGFDLVRLAVGSWGALGVITEATLRLFPMPAVDRTLVAHSDDPSELFAAGRLIAGGPVEVAALELIDPGLEPSEEVSLVLRLIGSSSEVDAVVEKVMALTSWVDWRTLSEAEGAHVWDRLRAWDRDAPIAVGIGVLPSRLGEIQGILARFEVDWEQAAGSLRVTTTADVVGGRMRVGVHPGNPALEAPAQLLLSLRGAVEAHGGTLRMLQCDPGLGARIRGAAKKGPEHGIVKGILEAFDPAAVLSGERFGR